jgi:coenzyme F420 hydrogenase subunit beta
MNLKMIKDYCPGCGLCQSVLGEHKITVTCSDNGFYKPDFKKIFKKLDYNILKKFCPAYSINKKDITTGKSTNFWGNIQNCFAAYANENEIRENASSGGIITAVLYYLLYNNFIDAAIEVGPDNQNKLLNKTYINVNLKELLDCSNSRYSPSSTLIDILQNINPQKRYALVGKPCDIYAIKKYYSVRKETSNPIKYYISFFCAGIPSYNGTKELLETLNIDLANLSELHYRKDGWPGYFKARTKMEHIIKCHIMNLGVQF